MIKTTVEWEGPQVFEFNSPTRKHRREYLELLKAVQDAKDNDKVSKLQEWLEWRTNLALSLMVPNPERVKQITKENLDEVPIDVLDALSESIESRLVLGKDFRTPSNGQ